MNLQSLRDRPSPALARALTEFESRFTYPLGPGRSFRISHGEDYPRFFRSMGSATCFVAEQAGRVTGTLSVAIRTVMTADGGTAQAAYIGDLKVDPAARGSLAFIRLARDADRWARPQVQAAFGVVMDGTRASPTAYTGRIGVPAFLEIGKIVVLRFATAIESGGRRLVAPAAQGEACHLAMTRGRFVATGGDPAERSEIAPTWLIHPERLACGRLEDTRRAKCLIDNDGFEMKSAHLACFAWRTPQAASELIQAASRHAAGLGLPALFVAVSERDMLALETALGPVEKVIAPATVYGAGLPGGADWNINSSEI